MQASRARPAEGYDYMERATTKTPSRVRQGGRLQPSEPMGHLMLGSALYWAGNVPQAEAEFRAGLKARSDNRPRTSPHGHPARLERPTPDSAYAEFQTGARWTRSGPTCRMDLGSVEETWAGFPTPWSISGALVPLTPRILSTTTSSHAVSPARRDTDAAIRSALPFPPLLLIVDKLYFERRLCEFRVPCPGRSCDFYRVVGREDGEAQGRPRAEISRASGIYSPGSPNDGAQVHLQVGAASGYFVWYTRLGVAFYAAGCPCPGRCRIELLPSRFSVDVAASNSICPSAREGLETTALRTRGEALRSRAGSM